MVTVIKIVLTAIGIVFVGWLGLLAYAMWHLGGI